MNATSYQKEAHKFASYGSNYNYPIVGLAEEAGEVCGKIAKFIRKHDGTEPIASDNIVGFKISNGELDSAFTDDMAEFKKNMSKELGDVLWMVAEICTIFGFDLEEVMEENIAKLTDRFERGVIVGEGDNR